MNKKDKNEIKMRIEDAHGIEYDAGYLESINLQYRYPTKVASRVDSIRYVQLMVDDELSMKALLEIIENIVNEKH